MADEHELLYRSGSFGLEHLGLRDAEPRWFCRCRGWSFPAVAKPRRRTGVNKAEALSAWHAHMRVTKKADANGA